MNLLRRLFRIGHEQETKPEAEPEAEPGHMGYIRRCLWKKDIFIERSSFVGRGKYGAVKGKHYHTVTCAADGPNNDPGKTFHHGFIGNWDEFSSFQEANEFASKLYDKVIELTGFTPPVYASGKDKNGHAGWCMGTRKTRPKGIHPKDLPITFGAYS